MEARDISAWLALMLPLGLLAGCRPPAPSGAPPSTSAPTSSSAPISSGAPTPSKAAAVDPGLGAASDGPAHVPIEAEAARSALADELGLDPGAIAVRQVEAVTWNDSALGCPEPGQSYLQVLTPGYKITLAHEGGTAVYHTDRAEGSRPATAVRCDKELTTGPLEPVRLPPLASLAAAAIDAARADLEKRIGSGSTLAVQYIGASDVSDLVCGSPSEVTPGTGPEKVIIELHLRAGDEVHVYRTWKDEVLYCGLAPGPAVE